MALRSQPANGEAPAQYPAVCAIAMPHPMLAFEHAAGADTVSLKFALNTGPIVGMHQTEPDVETAGEFEVFIAEHRLPAGGIIYVIGESVPVPDTIVGPCNRKSVPFSCGDQFSSWTPFCLGYILRQARRNRAPATSPVHRTP